MNAMSLHSVFSSLLTRYRQQVTDLDAAADQDDIDRLVNASQDTLTELAGTRPRSAAAMADKVQELIRRYDDFGALPMDLVRELLADTYHLASEPGLTLAWVHLWSDLGGWIIDQGEGHRYLGLPEPLRVTDTFTANLPAAYKPSNEAEAVGASKALRALLHLAGRHAADHVFAFSQESRA
ncbi:hypothetical protein KZ810_03355 [Sphingomonas sp. RHCKR47]|uniref:hypothetical protein n=1 Tax=Sphingomonas citricola TaxID=2862498 RepID=UPI001CA4CCC9|nr:hypothetical protein [Sphingomonas citricola]MBW6522524.1 hypothetical protein [Sphingomonas citricola]